MGNYKRLGVYLGTLGAMLIWGIAFVWTKIVFEYYGPFTTLLFRLIIYYGAYSQAWRGRERRPPLLHT